LFLDGHAENKDNDIVSVKRSDGFFAISVSPKMKAELYNAMVADGEDPEVADRVLNDFCNDSSYMSYRGAADPKTGDTPMKLKGLGCKQVSVQDYLRSRGVTKTPDGRNIDDIVFFIDETVLKTTIGEGKAYATFEDWCRAMGEKVYIGSLVKTHPKAKKDVSYQVVQSLCEGTPEMVREMAQKTINRVNNYHTVNGATKLLGREWGEVMKLHPEVAN
jgi:hypothetical protein